MTLLAGQKAPKYAQAKIARAAATRSGYTTGAPYITVAGVHVGYGRASPSVGVILESLTIRDVLNEAPNTCNFRIHGSVPAVGAAVIVTLGSKNRIDPLFAGYALTVTQRYAADNPRWVQADVAAVDYTWLLGFVKVTAQYKNQSATAIAQDLIARWGAVNGFTAAGVVAGLPVVPEITFTNEDLPDCLSRLAGRIGAYWYVDYLKAVHLFFDDVTNGAPIDLTLAHKSLAHVTRDGTDTQVITRVYIEGRGTKVIAPVAVGSTEIPIEAAEMFEAAADVFAKVSFQGAEGGAQHVTFTGVVQGGAGAIVGPGVTPSNAPALALASGAGVNSGTHQYAYTWQTAAGETLPAPIASITTGATAADPTTPPTLQNTAFTSGFGHTTWNIGDLVAIVVTYLTAGGETLASAVSNVITAGQGIGSGSSFACDIDAPSLPVSSDPAVTHKRIYVYAVTSWRCYGTVPNSWISAYQLMQNGVLTNFGPFAPPVTNTTAANQVAVSAIAVGPAAVTGRKLYRTVAAGAQLKFVTTIANNTATTYTDATPDASLGANAPSGDTSGLAQPSGQITPGASTILVTSTAAFRAAGGSAVIGNGEQVIRYTGLSGNTLIGVPASGAGAVTAPIAYGASITAANLLAGIPASGAGAVVLPITPGDEIYFVVQADQTATQAALAALGAGTGIREEWGQDRRLSLAEARARAQATLALRPLNIQTLKYTSRDLLTASGKKITAALPAPTNISGTYRIQSVTINNFRPYPNQLPTFTVDASSVLFRFEDFLRMIRPEH